MSTNLTSQEVMAYTTEISAAYLASHEISLEAIPAVLRAVFFAVVDVSREAHNSKHMQNLTPAVPVEDSVHDEYIVCLEDGKKLQMLKRHLNTVYGISIEEYKERWGLPADYPVVSPKYAKRRSDIAKTTGLGSNGRKKNLRVA